MSFRPSTRLTRIVLLLLSAAVFGCASSPSKQPALAVRQTDTGYLFTENGDSVLLYRHRPRFRDSVHARSHYIHPLYGLNGQVLTEDFPDDHLHQHGIFWAWHQIYAGGQRLGDGWTQEDITWDVYRVDVLEETDTTAALRAHVHWTSPRWTREGDPPEPFLRETTTLRAHRTENNHRAVDVVIRLRAMTDSVQLGGSENRKGYGGFSARLHLPDDLRFTGADGSVEPSTYQVDGGPWLDFSGSFQGQQPSGVAILTHPSLPTYPPPWILRRSDSMQNAVFPGRLPATIPRDSSLTLRYRMIVHRGRAADVPLDSLHRRYADQPTAPFEK